jgi:hypothetical protein
MADGVSLTPTSRVVRCGRFAEAEVDGEVVVLHVERGTCYGLNRVGSRVWQLMAAPIPITNIVSTIRNEFDDVPENCERDVLELLDGLRLEGLIEIVSAPPINPNQ